MDRFRPAAIPSDRALRRIEAARPVSFSASALRRRAARLLLAVLLVLQQTGLVGTKILWATSISPDLTEGDWRLALEASAETLAAISAIECDGPR
jgi:hypothetical protein